MEAGKKVADWGLNSYNKKFPNRKLLESVNDWGVFCFYV